MKILKLTLITIVLLIVFTTTKAQQKYSLPPKADSSSYQKPSFLGGIDSLYKFLGKYIYYPVYEYSHNIQGTVYLSFIVEKGGKLSHIKAYKGVSKAVDAQAVYALAHNSHLWIPGTKNGKQVKMLDSVPIVFKIAPPDITTNASQKSIHLPDSLKIFTAVEHEPEFKGGMKAFYKYLQQNLRYPASAAESHIQGKVFVSFIVEKDGSLTDIRVARGLSEDIDAEAIRVMKECPNWAAGIQNGKTVRVAYTVPISFNISN